MNKSTALLRIKADEKEVLTAKFFEFNPRKSSYSGENANKNKVLDNNVNFTFSPIHIKSGPKFTPTSASTNWLHSPSKESDKHFPWSRKLNSETKEQSGFQIESIGVNGIRMPSRVQDSRPKLVSHANVAVVPQHKPKHSQEYSKSIGNLDMYIPQKPFQAIEKQSIITRNTCNIYEFDELKKKLKSIVDLKKPEMPKQQIRRRNRRAFYSNVEKNLMNGSLEKHTVFGVSEKSLPSWKIKTSMPMPVPMPINEKKQQESSSEGFRGFKPVKFQKYNNFEEFEHKYMIKKAYGSEKHNRSPLPGLRMKTEDSLSQKPFNSGLNAQKTKTFDVLDDHSPEPWSTYHLSDDENHIF